MYHDLHRHHFFYLMSGIALTPEQFVGQLALESHLTGQNDSGNLSKEKIGRVKYRYPVPVFTSGSVLIRIQLPPIFVFRKRIQEVIKGPIFNFKVHQTI